ncbi:LicD family protein [Aeromonas veronii]|uniref:LicD family protein n=1 Tax=Aeromonas veronii TaxID=654 RepID=UPI0038D2A173
MSDVLRHAQLLLVDAFKELDDVCAKIGVSYWIDAGSLLGAVRHGGFIPWDDDIDVCMIRSDYYKFLELAPDLLSKKYFIQTVNTDRHYSNIGIPCKLRINNTEIIEKFEVEMGCFNKNEHHGLFIDIFPYDNYSKNRFIRTKVQRAYHYVYRLKRLSLLGNLRGFKKVLSYVLTGLGMERLDSITRYLATKMSKNEGRGVYAAGIETPFHRACFDEGEIFPVSRIKFENIDVNCPANIDSYLLKMFGDTYMALPKEELRVSHYHSIKIGAINESED